MCLRFGWWLLSRCHYKDIARLQQAWVPSTSTTRLGWKVEKWKLSCSSSSRHWPGPEPVPLYLHTVLLFNVMVGHCLLTAAGLSHSHKAAENLLLEIMDQNFAFSSRNQNFSLNLYFYKSVSFYHQLVLFYAQFYFLQPFSESVWVFLTNIVSNS